ncbi:DUF6318 family protein [Kocuria atrinae]|uniref:DUF6318 domain-containing protein n=1 Tax=Kocuria atrinae TaxID=592377 RepID=A0ABP5K0G5_9MICC
MGDALKRRKFAASLAALALGLTLAGCNDTPDPEPEDTATSAGGSSSSSPEASDGGASDSQSSSPDPSASGDWWPEQPEKMATGQEFPDDYEPATLEHPARNVPKPVMPEEAKQETEAGAQAFLDYRTDAQWYLMQTGDASLVRKVTSNSCEACERQFTQTEDVYSSGHWVAGGLETYQVISDSFLKSENGTYTVPVGVNNRGAKIIENNDVAIEQKPIRSMDDLDVSLIFENGGWLYITASPRGSL